MAASVFLDDFIKAHCVLQERAAKQERVIERLARLVAAERGCPFPNERRCPACGDGDQCWHCWVLQEGREAERTAGG